MLAAPPQGLQSFIIIIIIINMKHETKTRTKHVLLTWRAARTSCRVSDTTPSELPLRGGIPRAAPQHSGLAGEQTSAYKHGPRGGAAAIALDAQKG